MPVIEKYMREQPPRIIHYQLLSLNLQDKKTEGKYPLITFSISEVVSALIGYSDNSVENRLFYLSTTTVIKKNFSY